MKKIYYSEDGKNIDLTYYIIIGVIFIILYHVILICKSY